VGIYPGRDLLLVLVVIAGIRRSCKQGVGEDNYIFIVFLSLVVIRPPGECIRTSISLSCHVVYFDGIVGEFDYLPRYSTTNLLGVPPML
jgi:hypothetical protein